MKITFKIQGGLGHSVNSCEFCCGGSLHSQDKSTDVGW
jgi:hypothetical protein